MNKINMNKVKIFISILKKSFLKIKVNFIKLKNTCPCPFKTILKFLKQTYINFEILQDKL